MRSKFMKKIILSLILLVSLTVSAFAYTEGKTLRDVGIPYKVSHIEFWNGGAKIAEYDNVYVEIIVQSNESYFTFTSDGNKVQFYIYKITDKWGNVEKIIDSEALAIKFKE